MTLIKKLLGIKTKSFASNFDTTYKFMIVDIKTALMIL